MDGDRKTDEEFTIDRGAEKDRGASTSSPRSASNVPPRERAEQAEFDLGAKGQREADGGMPERLRRKYYVAEADVGAEAKVYADPKGEYLAFKVTTERMATRLEGSGVIRDMVSIAQHRNWKEVELRGSEEFRRTAWLEASARGISVRGYEPDPVDRAALAFKTKPDPRSTRAPSQGWQREAEASETVSVAGVSTNRPIETTVLPPQRSTETRHRRDDREAQFQSPDGSDRAGSRGGQTAEWPSNRAAITIDVVPFRAEASPEPPHTVGQHRAGIFRSADHRLNAGDDVVRAARSQFAAIERALSKAVRDPVLRRSILAHAKARIAEQLERGGEFKHAELLHRDAQQKRQPESRSQSQRENRSKEPEHNRER
ncbi:MULTISPECIES: LPD7 domain-containing protein [Bosea]|uniref:LPD7 domain-containing protein n=1 Tax=Bosea TaxID=85413 RepID=UPI000ADB2A30|nr:LPD7 domain-containing protein [Bosea vaviloviae]